MPPQPLNSFFWEPFHGPKHSVCLSCYDSQFNKDNSPNMVATGHCPASELGHPGITILYHLHPEDLDSLIIPGSSILSHRSLCPPIESCLNHNFFQNYFGAEIHHNGSSYICGISTYKFAWCFGFSEQIQYCMSHEMHRLALNTSMPGWSSPWLFEQIHIRSSTMSVATLILCQIILKCVI